MLRVLLVEDDAEMAAYVADGLRQAGYGVEALVDGRAALAALATERFDAVVLDRMLPGLDGLSVLKAARAAGVRAPILLLTAMEAVDHRVEGLRAGADDYIVKPFSFAELQARLEAVLRRPQEVAAPSRLTCADLALDLVARTASRGARSIDLKQKEWAILEFLMRRQGRVVTRTMLLEGVWEYRFDPQTNVIDVHVSRLRRKIDLPDERPLIHTVRGAGYMLADKGAGG